MYKLVRAANFFDAVGLMVVEGLLSCEMTYKLFGEAEATAYKYYAPVLSDPQQGKFFKYFNALHAEFVSECKKEYEKLKEIEKKKTELEHEVTNKRRKVT